MSGTTLFLKQIRGFVSYMKEIISHANAFKGCTGCSTSIISAYKKDGVDFVMRAITSPAYLEEITGLLEMKEMTENIDVDWDDDKEDF